MVGSVTISRMKSALKGESLYYMINDHIPNKVDMEVIDYIDELDPNYIINRVRELLNVVPDESRSFEQVRCRQISASILINEGLYYTQVGRLLNKDHSTIIHYIKKHKNYMDTDKNYKNLYHKIIFNL